MSASPEHVQFSPRPPTSARRTFDRLEGHREALQQARDSHDRDRQNLSEYLAVADDIKLALDAFSEQLFAELIRILESQLTRALQDVLDQPIQLKAERGSRAGAITLGFYIQRGGQRENILKGQGGSVVNILSIGLRLLALHGEDPKCHRRFLVLDEQDCWLRPDLLPRLVGMIHHAGRQMGFQVLMVSHHDPANFANFADRIYRCRPKITDGIAGVQVERLDTARSDAGDLS